MVYTVEGYTFSPKCEGSEPDFENFQILDFVRAQTPESAFNKFKKDSGKMFKEAGFIEIHIREVSTTTDCFYMDEE